MSREWPRLLQMLTAFLGSFCGIAITAYFSFIYHAALLVPSFGASAVLLYAAPHLPMAKARSVLGGHLVSALVGVTVYQLFGLYWWSVALGVSLAIVVMMITDTLHPPGGATAFAAVFTQQNYTFVVMPVVLGVVILMAVAVIIRQLKY